MDILIVGAEDDRLRTLARFFEANLCVVRTVSSPHESEAALFERLPDVVLSDLDVRDGSAHWAFAERLRDDPRTSHVARVAISRASDRTGDLARAFDAYVVDPIDKARMLQLARQLAAASRVERMMAERQSACA